MFKLKPVKRHVRPAKTQIRLIAKDQSFLHMDSEDVDQTGRMPRLIGVFTGCTCHFVGFVMLILVVSLIREALLMITHNNMENNISWYTLTLNYVSYAIFTILYVK